MAIVKHPCASACLAERLAWARTRPHGSVVAPASQPESVRPEPDPREKVDLPVSDEVSGSDVSDVPLVDVAGSNVPCRDEVSEPLGTIAVLFVIVGRHPGLTLLQMV